MSMSNKESREFGRLEERLSALEKRIEKDEDQGFQRSITRATIVWGIIVATVSTAVAAGVALAVSS